MSSADMALRGCCPTCRGTGAGDANGSCWDCYGTGCAHPDPCDPLQCRCAWRGERCPNVATEEDGLCNWCGNNRSDARLRKDPRAVIGPDGKLFGISGGGQLHDVDATKPASTAACWYPDSDRVVV